MWYNDNATDADKIDITFYPNAGQYRGNIYKNGKMIGDCGITMQIIHGAIRPEIGYHINKNYQRKGYASEAAQKVRDYVFENTPFNRSADRN